MDIHEQNVFNDKIVFNGYFVEKIANEHLFWCDGMYWWVNYLDCKDLKCFNHCDKFAEVKNA